MTSTPPQPAVVRVSDSEAETAAIGGELARRLTVGDVVLLEGPLGAGKTAFARGLAEGLGCNPDDVSSPTFTLVQEYRPASVVGANALTLEHVDLYRLTPDEVDDLGLEDLLDTGVIALEWPDRWRRAPPDAIRVTLEILDGSRRRITIAGSKG